MSDVDAAFAEPEGAFSAPTASGGAPTPRATQSLNPDLALILDVAGAYYSDDEPLQAGAHDPARTGFNLQALEIAAGSVVDPFFRLNANLVFSETEVELEEAYGTTLDLPAGLQARIGQFLQRFGRQNPTHPHAWDFVDQPFALGRVFGGEGLRGVGVEASWLTPLPWFVELVGSTQMADGEESARSFYGGTDLGVDGPEDLLYVAALKQFFDLDADWSLAWGLSGAFGPNSSGASNYTDVFGTDVYLKYRPIRCASPVVVAVQSEWLHRRRQVPNELLSDTNGYAQLFVRFAERWAAALRYEYGSPAYGQGGEVAPDPLDPEWESGRGRASANLTFWPSEFSRLRLQGSRDEPGFRDPIWAAFLTAELVSGAHGAHAF